MDNQIKKDFKYRRFASLEYLSNEDAWAENETNLGLYFFLLDLKNKDTSIVFNRILDIKESLACSYKYLGDIARKLFDEIHGHKVAIYYFKKALKYDDKDAYTLWNLFDLTRNSTYFLMATKIDYEGKVFPRISNNFNSLSIFLVESNFLKSDWQVLKNVCQNENVTNCEDILIISCFYLGDFENGIDVMNKKEHVSKRIIDLYLNAGYIDTAYALQKSYYFERLKYLEGDAKLIYKEANQEAKKSELNPSKEVLIKYAFEAEEYSDVISLVDEYTQGQKTISHQVQLYHVLSSLYLGFDINENYEIAVNKQNFFRESNNETKCNPLYLAYLVLINIKKLEAYLGKRDELHSIEHWGLYQEAKSYLSHDSLLNHYIHESLVEKINSLKDVWDSHILNLEIEKLKSINEPLSCGDSIKLASYLTDAGCYDEAIELLTELEPVMTVNNTLGVCYEKLGKLETALAHYKSAISLMKLSGEIDDVIISNYLSCLKKSSNSIPSSLFNEYIDDFNKSIAERFRYNISTAENSYSLFKYYPFNQFTLDALVNSYFYLASSEQLNDPIELPFESLTSDAEHLFLRPNFRLASFSNNENSMLMWSHYAANHSGLMVEYCFEGELPEGVGIARVDYSNTIKRLKEKKHYLFNQYMLTKNKDWSYEKEVRLFAYKRDKVYYEEPSYPKKLDNKANVYIRSITVGYKFPKSTIKLIENIIADLNNERDVNLSRIELKTAKLSEKNFFELEYEVIN